MERYKNIKFKYEEPEKTITRILELLEFTYGRDVVKAFIWSYYNKKENKKC